MIIGNFKADEDGGYIGQLDTLGLTISGMTFCPIKDKQGNSPDFTIIGYGDFEDIDPDYIMKFAPGEPVPNPNSYEVGAAWKKTSQKGKPYLSVKLDGPTLPAPIHCRLIERKDGSYSLIWQRKDEEHTTTEQAAA